MLIRTPGSGVGAVLAWGSTPETPSPTPQREVPYEDGTVPARTHETPSSAAVRFYEDEPQRWAALRTRIDRELTTLQEMPKAEREAYVRGAAAELATRLQRAHGTIGWHYNHHGGRAEQYLEAGGLYAQAGDISLQFDHRARPKPQTYFFRADHTDLYDIIDARDPTWWGLFGRMGSVLIPFRTDHPALQRARQEGGITEENAICMTFSRDWLAKQPYNRDGRPSIGIPACTFLSPPLPVFSGLRKRLGWGRRLDRHAENLVTLRYLEQLLLKDAV